MDKNSEQIIMDAFAENMKKIQTKSILAGGKAACAVVLEKIEKAKNNEEAIQEIKKFCTASINLYEAQEIINRKENDEK